MTTPCPQFAEHAEPLRGRLISSIRALATRLRLSQLLLAACTCAAFLSPASVFGASRVLTVNAPPVYVGLFSIAQNATAHIWTVNLSAGADTVMYLLRETSPGNYVLVASNDDYNYPNLNSAISHTNTQGTAYYMIVVRSYSGSSTGTCSIQINNVIKKTGVPVNGNVISASQLEFSGNELIQTAHEPGGSVAPMIAKLTSTTLMTGIGMGNGIGWASHVSASGAPTMFLVGTPQLHVIDSFSEDYRAGTTVLLVNDNTQDADQDGVGNLLEAALGTCPTLSNCGAGTHTGADTDRDGLSDSEEIWGVASAGYNDVSFRRWGANPRKKDAFFELDWHAVFNADVGAAGPFAHRRAYPNHPLWGGETLEQWVDVLRSKFLAAPASHIKNPDGSDGIELHLDLGVAPLNPADERKFGAWPTGSVRAVAFGHEFNVLGPINGLVWIEFDTPSGVTTGSFNATGLTPQSIALSVAILINWLDTDDVYDLTHLSDTRATFTPVDRTVFAAVRTGGLDPSSMNLAQWRQAIEHQDVVNTDGAVFDPVRRNRVRWGVVGPGGGGNADKRSLEVGLNALDVVHEMGHTMGLDHWGHDAWSGLQTNCAPTYYSLMSYAKFPFAFSAGGVPDHSPMNSNEIWPAGVGVDHSYFLNWPFSYLVPTSSSSVDFTRDGTISSTAGRGFGLLLNGSSCRAFLQGRQELGSAASGGLMTGSPDLARAGNRLYAFWSDASGTNLLYRHTALGAAGNKSCTGSADPSGSTPCLTWSSTSVLSTGSTGAFAGVTALEYAGSVHAVVRSSSGAMVAYRFSVGGGGALVLAASQVMPSGSDQLKTSSTPELVVRHQNLHSRKLGLLYLANDGVYRSFGWDGSNWTAEGALLDTSNVQLTGTQGVAAKAWPDASLAGWNANEHMTLAVLPDALGNVRIFKLGYYTNSWTQLAWNQSVGQATSGKPMLEFRTLRNAAGQIASNYAGHFLIGWGSPSAVDGTRTYVQVSRQFNRASPPGFSTTAATMTGDIGDFLADTWARLVLGSSTVLYSDPILDNVFGLTSYRNVRDNVDGLSFLPHADLSPGGLVKVGSDYRVMEDWHCGNLENMPCGTMDVNN